MQVTAIAPLWISRDEFVYPLDEEHPYDVWDVEPLGRRHEFDVDVLDDNAGVGWIGKCCGSVLKALLPGVVLPKPGECVRFPKLEAQEAVKTNHPTATLFD